MSESIDKKELLALTTDIVTSYLAKNSVEMSDLSRLVQDVYGTLSSAGSGAESAEPPEPAVPVNKSVQPDFLICLEDGKKLKMLKRHLKTSFNMTPDEYRQRWNLPADYPMVAPNYAKHRRRLAREIGLGTHRAKAAE